MTPEKWSRVKEVLDAAWQQEADERAAFLDQACAEDRELRAEVEALLESDENASEFLAASAVAMVENPLTEDSGESSTGRRIGPYQILRELGHGGMGTVYLAERADGQYRKRVAIKLVNPHLGTENILQRFRNERQVLAALAHPNIAGLLDGAATEDGLPYLVMEYVEGVRIDTWCESRKLTVRKRLELFRQVCAAVQSAHEQQVIHRDIKPANILVTAEGTPKLLDFGIAKVLDRKLSTQALETTIGAAPMTPEYASPEQVRNERVTLATDVYSLGTVLYELLTGERAHRIQSYSAGEIEKEICVREPRKPSEVVRDLDPDLDNIVLKALRKEPERRYASVQELSEDVDRFLKDLPVQARKESVIYRSRKFLKRNRALIVAAALSAVVVLMLLVGLGRFAGPGAPAIRSIAVLPLENLSRNPDQEYFADGITIALMADLAKVKSLRVTSRESIMRYRNAQKPPASIARELNVEALVAGSVLRSGNRVQVSLQLKTGSMDRALWTQTYDRDLQDVPALQSDAARAIAREIQIRLTPEEEALSAGARPVNQQAYEAYLRGRYQVYKHTQEGFKKSIEHFKEAIDIDSAYAPAWAALADGYYESSTTTLPPREAMPKARAAALRALAIDPTLPEPHATLAQIQSQYDWDWTASEVNLKRALELNPSYAQAHFYYGFYLSQRGRLEEAIREMETAYRLDPLPPRRATNVAWTHYLARRFDEAIARYHKILGLDPDAPVTRYSLGQAYEQKGMLEEAAAEYLKAAKLDVDSPSPLSLLGHVYAISGKLDHARSILEKLLKGVRQNYVDGYLVGIVSLGLGETDSAFKWFEKAYEERSEELLFLKVDPRLDRIRSDPRYKSLVRRIGLPP